MRRDFLSTKRRKPRNVTNFERKRPSPTRYLVNAEALRGAFSEEFALSFRLGEMIEHFGPKMTMLNKVLAPDVMMDPCLNAFWELLDRVADKIEVGEWK